MDLNLYNLHFVYGLFGSPARLAYHAHKHPNGIDTSGVLVLAYPDFVCQCTAAKNCRGDNGVSILGEKGWILSLIHIYRRASRARRSAGRR